MTRSEPSLEGCEFPHGLGAAHTPLWQKSYRPPHNNETAPTCELGGPYVSGEWGRPLMVPLAEFCLVPFICGPALDGPKRPRYCYGGTFPNHNSDSCHRNPTFCYMGT